MKHFFTELWWYLRFLWYSIFYKEPTITSEPELIEEPKQEPEEPEVFEYTDETSPSVDELEIQINEEDMVKQGTKKVVICLDNGHGEETPGKRSPWLAKGIPPELPLREYAYCREIVSRLAKVLNEDGYPVFVVVPESRQMTSPSLIYLIAACAMAFFSAACSADCSRYSVGFARLRSVAKPRSLLTKFISWSSSRLRRTVISVQFSCSASSRMDMTFLFSRSSMICECFFFFIL